MTTLPGQTAHIEMVTERFFPEDWETIDLKTSDNNTSGETNTTSSSWRTLRADPQPQFESEPRKLGIVFDITPEVDRERRTITAPIVFPIQTFSDWMVFDARVSNSDSDSDSDSDDDEYFKMPIFDRREINTMITVYDGDTVVLGGVASDTTEVLFDKIPVLGDLPFIGAPVPVALRECRKTQSARLPDLQAGQAGRHALLPEGRAQPRRGAVRTELLLSRSSGEGRNGTSRSRFFASSEEVFSGGGKRLAFRGAIQIPRIRLRNTGLNPGLPRLPDSLMLQKSAKDGAGAEAAEQAGI